MSGVGSAMFAPKPAEKPDEKPELNPPDMLPPYCVLETSIHVVPVRAMKVSTVLFGAL